MEDNTNVNRTEGAYIELADCFKERIEQINRKYKKRLETMDEIIKRYLTAYSAFRLLSIDCDNLIENGEGIPFYFIETIDRTRGHLSEGLDLLIPLLSANWEEDREQNQGDGTPN